MTPTCMNSSKLPSVREEQGGKEENDNVGDLAARKKNCKDQGKKKGRNKDRRSSVKIIRNKQKA